jgi:hypothetical protein
MLSVLLERTPTVRCLKRYGTFLWYYKELDRLPFDLRVNAIVKIIGDGDLPALGAAEREAI